MRLRREKRRDEAATQSIFTGRVKGVPPRQEQARPERDRERARGEVNLGLVGFWIMQLSRSLLACKFFTLALCSVECVARKCLNDTTISSGGNL